MNEIPATRTSTEIMTVEDTPSAMLPPPHGSQVPPQLDMRPWYRDRFSVAVLVLVSVLVVGVVGFYTVPAQWIGRITPGSSIVDDGAVALKPGSARATDDRVSVSNIEIFVPEGEILFKAEFTDLSGSGRVNLASTKDQTGIKISLEQLDLSR